MRAEGTGIAFFGAMTLLAKELRALLETRAFHTGTVRLYDTGDEGAVTEFGGEAMVVTAPDEESIVDLDIAFLCGTAAQTAPYLDWPARRRFVAIDLSGASLGRRDVPLVHCGINPGDIAGPGRTPPPVIGAPHPIAHNLAGLVAAARAAGRITGVEALALRPASELGDPGIDELYKQTVALLSFASVPQDVFGRQMAFNIVPTSGVGGRAGVAFDERLHAETAGLLGMSDEQVSIDTAFAPVFHGHAMWVALSFERAPDPAALKEALKAARGVKLVEGAETASPAELAGEEDLAILHLRHDPHRSGRVTLWSFCDNLKGGASLNAVRIAERVADLARAAR